MTKQRKSPRRKCVFKVYVSIIDDPVQSYYVIFVIIIKVKFLLVSKTQGLVREPRILILIT